MTIRLTPRNRARLKHLLSYVLLSALPVILCGALVIQNSFVRRADQEDITAWNGLNLFSTTYSALLGAMDSCAGHLADNLKRYDAEGYESLPHQLYSYEKNYSLFTSVLYYQKGDEGIYASDGYVNYHLFETRFRRDYEVDLNMTTLFSGMNGAIANTALRSRSSSAKQEDGAYIFYLRTVPALDARPRGVVVFCVSTLALRQLLEECVPAGYSLYLYSDQYLTWLFRSDSGAESAHIQDSLYRLSASERHHTHIAGSDYLLLRAKSETDNMYHMMAYDCDSLYAEYRADRARAVGMLSLLLVLAIAAAYCLHRYMYTPIDTILDLPLPRPSDGDADGGNPAGLLNGVAERAMKMIDQNEKLQEQLEDQRALLRTQYLVNLIYGEGIVSSAASLPNPYENPFPYDNYTAAYAEFASNPDSLSGEAKELSARDGRVFIVPMRAAGQIAIIANHGNMERAAIAAAALSALEDMGAKPLKVGLGLTYRRRERVPVSLLQAQAVARSSEGSARMYFFADDADGAQLSGFLPFSGKLLLCQCIRNGRRDIALSTLHQMRADILPLSGNDTILRSWCFFLFDAIGQVLRENRLEGLLNDMPLEELLCLSQDELLASLERIVDSACERISSLDERLLEEKQAAMLRYTNERYREQSMSLMRLSEEFKLSESYITRFFKQETGLSFLQYISQLRLDWIRGQLASTDRPIKDIVNEAGYSDIANFTRKFRQIEGVTPGAYRQSRRVMQTP